MYPPECASMGKQALAEQLLGWLLADLDAELDRSIQIHKQQELNHGHPDDYN